MFQWIRREFEQARQLLQFGFLKTAGQALGMIAPLVIAKFFSPELFGSYSLAKMVVFFFTALLVASAQTPFIVFASQERNQTGKINKSFSVQCVFLSFSIAIYLLLSFVCRGAITAFAKISQTDLIFMSLAFIGISLKMFLDNLLMSLGLRLRNALVELIYGSLILAFIFIFYLNGMLGLKTIFLAYFLSSVLVSVIVAVSVDFDLLMPFSLDLEYFKGMLDFAKWVVLGGTAAYFINWGDNLVLRYFVSMKDIGQYNLGYQIFTGVGVLTFVISTYFVPFISQHINDASKIRIYLYNKRPKIFFLGLAGIGLIFVAVPYVLNFIYGGVYAESIPVLRILLIGSVLILYTTFYEAILYALKSYKFTQTVNLFQVLLNLLLDVILVPVMGISGAAAATVFAYLCRAVIIEVYFRLKLRELLKLTILPRNISR